MTANSGRSCWGVARLALTLAAVAVLAAYLIGGYDPSALTAVAQ